MVSAGRILDVSTTYGPSVDSEVAVAVRLVGASVGDGPGRASCPSLASDKVALVVAPFHVEVAAIAVGVGSIALAAMREERTSVNTLVDHPGPCTHPSVQ